ncbi:uncharacterized protein [Miscanthus floridulus]|uniref:uncharacterized protein n=1 Tax=Miscanthus floridulus TaxID=154761 RepID=UPI003458536A
MKVKLRARRLWNAVDKGTDNEEDDISVLEAILTAVPAEYRELLGTKSSAKEEYVNLKFKDGEIVEDFSLRMQTLIDKLKSHGITIDEKEAVSKYLHSVPEKKAEAHLAQIDDEDEATILMATFCALHSVEAEKREEATMVEGPRKALKTINLDEPCAQVHLGRAGANQEQWWYLDSGASNHMTGSKASFSELDDDVTGTVKFGDGSWVAIQGRDTIIFQRRLPFPKVAKYRMKDALELVHGDICGPITLATCGGRRYFLLLMDDCSRYMWLQLLTSKDEVAAAIKKFKTCAEAESGKKLHMLRTDRGDEFTSVEFAVYYADQGVEQHHTAPYSPQQNGVLEQRN